MKASLRKKRRRQILSMGPRAGDRMPTMFGISVLDMNRAELIACTFELQQTLNRVRNNLDNRVY